MTDPDDAYAVVSEARWLLPPASEAETLFRLLDYIATSYAPSARAPPEYGCSTAAVRTAVGALAASGGHVTLIECSPPLLGVGRVSSAEQSAVYGTEDESSMYLRSQDESFYSELGVTCAMASVCVDFVVASREHVHLAEQQMLAAQSGGAVYLVKEGAAGLAELHAYLQTLVIREHCWDAVAKLRVSGGLKVQGVTGNGVPSDELDPIVPLMHSQSSFEFQLDFPKYIDGDDVFLQFAILYPDGESELCGERERGVGLMDWGSEWGLIE